MWPSDKFVFENPDVEDVPRNCHYEKIRSKCIFVLITTSVLQRHGYSDHGLNNHVTNEHNIFIFLVTNETSFY
jgi:hypothetical protein